MADLDALTSNSSSLPIRFVICIRRATKSYKKIPVKINVPSVVYTPANNASKG